MSAEYPFRGHRTLGQVMRDAKRGDGWITMASGRRIWPHDVRPSDVDIEDVARGLAYACRWNRQCKRFYSVAQHSVNVHDVLKGRFPKRPALWLAGLLHDAGEAYLFDAPSPYKPRLPDYVEHETQARRAVFEAVGLEPDLPPEVDEIDKRLAHDEAIALMPDTVFTGTDWPPPLRVAITFCMPPETARETFLRRFTITSARAGAT